MIALGLCGRNPYGFCEGFFCGRTFWAGFWFLIIQEYFRNLFTYYRSCFGHASLWTSENIFARSQESIFLLFISPNAPLLTFVVPFARPTSCAQTIDELSSQSEFINRLLDASWGVGMCIKSYKIKRKHFIRKIPRLSLCLLWWFN